MKKIFTMFFAIAAFACLFSGTFALGIEAKNPLVEKGSAVELSGTAYQGTVSAKIFYENILVKEGQATADENGYFSYSYRIGFSEPSGNWKAVVSQGNDANTVSFTVENSQESAFLLVKITSPEKTGFVSTEKIFFSAIVTDSGSPVERALVTAWVPGMEKTVLLENQKGVYSGEISLPASLQPGEYNFVITAEKAFSSTERYGGENILQVKISRPEIVLEILQPSLFETRFEKQIEFLVQPEYSTGVPVENAEIYAGIQGEKIVFEKTGNAYAASYTPKQQQGEALDITIFAADSFGNSGKKQIPMRITGFFESFLEKNIAFIAAGIIIIALLAFFAAKKIKKKKSMKNNAGKTREIEMQMQQLEKNFYEKPTIDRKTFEETRRKYNEQLEGLKKAE